MDISLLAGEMGFPRLAQFRKAGYVWVSCHEQRSHVLLFFTDYSKGGIYSIRSFPFRMYEFAEVFPDDRYDTGQFRH